MNKETKCCENFNGEKDITKSCIFCKAYISDKLDDIYYALKLYKVGDWYRECKWFIQRGKRGYADCDLWNVNSHLASLIPRMLRELAKNNTGCPPEFYNQADAPNQCKAWELKLNEIAQGFEDYEKAENLIWEKHYPNHDDYLKEHKVLMSNFEKQGREFIKYFPTMWD